MIKRTLYIRNPSYLKLKQNKLVVTDALTQEEKGAVPIEDIALVLLDHFQITISNQVLIQLQGNNVAVITCDAHHLPLGMMLPLYGHTHYSERVKHQLEASEPLKKHLWKQTVQVKIKNQQALLQLNNRPYEAMDSYWQATKSGDTTNTEGKAAQHYWKHLFPNFQRDRFGDGPNALLNFGYAVLRSMVARALVSSGLLPVLGIFHRNKYNPYCLADDIMEPYRPFVDKRVVNYVTDAGKTDELTKEAKVYVLGIATQDVRIEEMQRPLLVAVTTTTASLYKCFTGELRSIKYPKLD